MLAAGLLVLPGITGDAAAKITRDVRLIVRGSNITLIGARGKDVSVRVRPVAGGVRVTPGSLSTLNGGESSIFVRNPTGTWLFQFGKSSFAGIAIEPPDEGVARARPRNVVVKGGRTSSRIRIEDLTVRRNLTINDYRAGTRFQAFLEMRDCTVGRNLRVLHSSHAPNTSLLGMTVGRTLKFRQRGQTLETETAGYTIIDCDLGALDAIIPLNEVNVTLEEATIVRGDVLLSGRIDLRADDTRIEGNLLLAAPALDRFVSLDVVTVDGFAELIFGDGSDELRLLGGSFGRLLVETGGADDLLTTVDVAVGAGSRFDAGGGDLDHWVTSDSALLEAISVELVDAPPPSKR